MEPLVAAHASAATVSMLVGARLLLRRRKGDREHRRLGVVWTGAMYFTLLSSFGIQELHPGRFSWIHGLSVLTLGTLTAAVWAAATGRTRVHRGCAIGSYFGLLGAFAWAVAAPQRDIPQLAAHAPQLLAGAVAACALATWAAIHVAGRRARRPVATGRREVAAAPASATP